LVNHLRLVAFDDAVVVGEEEEGFGIGALRRADGGADGADVVAQMRDAGGGYACEDAFLAHGEDFLLREISEFGLYMRTRAVFVMPPS